MLLAVGRYEPGATDEHGLSCEDPLCARNGHHQHHGADPGHDHGAAFSTWSFETDDPISLRALREMIRRELPGTVYRCKGVVHSTESPSQRHILQVVGRRSDITGGEAWGDQTPRSRIVAIGAPEALDPALLRRLFERCVMAIEPSI